MQVLRRLRHNFGNANLGLGQFCARIDAIIADLPDEGIELHGSFTP